MKLFYQSLFIITLVLFFAGCVSQQVSYRNDIEPILNDNCLKCHIPPDGLGYMKTGLKMGSYDSLMEGTIYGPVVIAGDSKRSILNMMAEGRVGQLRQIMHDKNVALSDDEIMQLKLWVDQGARNN
jgi:hypothetical protein